MFRGTILLLCAVGAFASAFMYRKTLRARRGLLAEPSVVQSPRAGAVGGISNAAIGLLYYAALATSVAFLSIPAVWVGAFVASLGAALLSAYLAYSLAAVTRMPCPYCWTSHAVNFAVPILLLLARA